MSQSLNKKGSRRTRKSIEEDIMGTTRQMIEEVGFSNVTFTGIAERSKTQTGVLYNWYNDLDGVLNAFADRYRYWLLHLVVDSNKSDENQDKVFFKRVIENVVEDLFTNKSMQRLLTWEFLHTNNTTQRNLKSREYMYNAISLNFLESINKEDLDTDVILALVFGGIYYISLIKDNSEYWGIDFNSDEGKQRLLETLDQFCEWLFTYGTPNNKEIEIAKKMKSKGIANNIIAECTGLSLEQIKKL